MTADVHPTVRGLLVWMQANDPRLRALMADEAADAEDVSPSGDAATRAHLRFVADALAANAAPARREELEAFRTSLPRLLRSSEAALQEHIDVIGQATVFEAEKQFGSTSHEDPGFVDTLDRRVRVNAWMRLFLGLLDAASPDRPPLAAPALAWMAHNQGYLADTIFSMDRRAKELEMSRGGPDAVADAEVVNRIGQATMLQSHVRFLVEAIAHAL